jgi:hypothetical protein
MFAHYSYDAGRINQTHVNDSTPYANNGQNVGLIILQPGKVNECVWDKGNNYSIMSKAIDETANFSFTAWVKPNLTAGLYGVISDIGLDSNNWMHFLIDNPPYKIRTMCRDHSGLGCNGTATFSTTGQYGFTDDVWQFVAYVHDTTANTLTMCVNTNCTTITLNMGDVEAFDAWQVGAALNTDQDLIGRVDEASFWNSSLTSADIASLYNSGNGVSYPFGVISSLFVNLTRPANNTHMNDLNFSFIVNATSVGDSICYIYVNDTNLWNVSLGDVEYSYFNGSLPDGNYSYWVNCTNGALQNRTTEQNIIVDTVIPAVNLIFPSPLNTSSFDLSMNITGNATDAYLWRVNVSIYNSTGDYLHTNFTDNINNISFNLYEQYLNTSTWPDGTHYIRIEAADSHTGSIFAERPVVLDYADKETMYLEKATLDFTHEAELDMRFVSEPDRISFLITGKEGPKDIIIRSSSRFQQVTKTEYPCHYVFADYWIDSVGLDNAVCQLFEDGHALSISYEQTAPEMTTRSLGGLNMYNLTASFTISHCVPAWTCSDYGACNSSDLKPCLNVTDTHSCGYPFTFNLSNYSTSCIYGQSTVTVDIDTEGLIFIIAICIFLALGFMFGIKIFFLISGVSLMALGFVSFDYPFNMLLGAAGLVMIIFWLVDMLTD